MEKRCNGGVLFLLRRQRGGAQVVDKGKRENAYSAISGGGMIVFGELVVKSSEMSKRFRDL
jgi:hypothetical protein